MKLPEGTLTWDSILSLLETIPNIINSLSTELRDKVEEIVDLTESREKLDADLEVAQRDARRLKIALEALTGSSIPTKSLGSGDSLQEVREEASQGSVPPPVLESLRPPVQRTPPRNPCNSCGGEMYYQARTLNNGKIVNLWVCGECSNERIG